jgi:hypothetical protein
MGALNALALVPFLVVLGVLFVVMLASGTYRYYKNEWKDELRKRMK